MPSLSSLASCQDRTSLLPRKKYLNPVELFNNKSLKTTTTATLMALYVDETQLGVAIADFSEISNKSTCRFKTLVMDESLGSALQDLISEHCVSGLVIGYPFQWERTFPTDVSFGMQVKHFVEKVIETSKFEDMNYTFWDSSCTTKMLFYLAKLTMKTTRCFIPLEFITVDYAAYEILEEYFIHLNDNQDPASDSRVLQCQIEMEPSAKGE